MISKAVERGARPDRVGADDLRKGKRDERSPGTLAQWWPAERPPGHLVISPVQVSLHIRGHRADWGSGAVAAIAVALVAALWAVWWR